MKSYFISTLCLFGSSSWTRLVCMCPRRRDTFTRNVFETTHTLSFRKKYRGRIIGIHFVIRLSPFLDFVVSFNNKAGYTTNRCDYRWAGAVLVAARLFQDSHNIQITLNQIFRQFLKIWHGRTEGRTHPFIQTRSRIFVSIATWLKLHTNWPLPIISCGIQKVIMHNQILLFSPQQKLSHIIRCRSVGP